MTTDRRYEAADILEQMGFKLVKKNGTVYATMKPGNQQVDINNKILRTKHIRRGIV